MEPFVEFAPSYEHVIPTNSKIFDWSRFGKGRLMDSKKRISLTIFEGRKVKFESYDYIIVVI